jgi:hypothetical protein
MESSSTGRDEKSGYGGIPLQKDKLSSPNDDYPRDTPVGGEGEGGGVKDPPAYGAKNKK